MNNSQFNKVLEKSFRKYLETSARSNKKLEILHGEIAGDLEAKLGEDYEIKSLGHKEGKESRISGRYVDKAVDITIFKDGVSLGGIAVKYVMSNYSQNSNNYFENMLGETANLRCNNKAYFQVVVLPNHVPYFDKDGVITKIETLKDHHLNKYIKLSADDETVYMHTPLKTLLYVIETPTIDKSKIQNKEEYKNYLLGLKDMNIQPCNKNYKFQDSVVYNDYEKFIDKVVNYIKFKS